MTSGGWNQVFGFILTIFFMPEVTGSLFLLGCLFYLVTGSRTSKIFLLLSFILYLSSLIGAR